MTGFMQRLCSILVLSFVLLISSGGIVSAGEQDKGGNTDSEQQTIHNVFIPIVSTEKSIAPQDEALPITVTEPDGTVVRIVFMPIPDEAIERAVLEGIVSESDAAYIREEQAKIEVSAAEAEVCTWYSDTFVATLRGSGRDSDDDYYKDYEHPEGLAYGYCVTPFYWGVKGWPSSDVRPPHYGPSLFRRRMVIGLTGFPDWFADLQAHLLLQNP
jgi:hypothetical protein